MNADSKETLPWTTEDVPLSAPHLGEDVQTELVPVVDAPALPLGEEASADPDTARALVAVYACAAIGLDDDLPSVVVSPELTPEAAPAVAAQVAVERSVLEARNARALEALTGETPTFPSVLQRVSGAVAAPFGFAGAASQRLLMTLASPTFRTDIERLTATPEDEVAHAGVPSNGSAFARVWRRAAALLLPTIGVTAVLAAISFPRLGIEDAFAGPPVPYELTPLVEGTSDTAQDAQAEPPAQLVGELPAALKVRLQGTQDHEGHKK